MSNPASYGWNNPAPGTSLWRLRNYPETMQQEDWERLARAYAAQSDALRAAAQALLEAAATRDQWDQSFRDAQDALRAALEEK